MFNSDLIDKVLIKPIDKGANQLIIISGYATPIMASWHIKKIKEMKLPSINIKLIVGMANYGGLTKEFHEGFKQLAGTQNDPDLSKFQCQYIYKGTPVHSKLYLWVENGKPIEAYAGSANYTQAGFGINRREYVVSCDASNALQYYNNIEKDSIYCLHSEVEENIKLQPSNPILDIENNRIHISKTNKAAHIRLSLLSKNGEVGKRSGLNWGQRPGREPNQAYIPLPAKDARSGFFPLEKQHFSVITDDNKNLILRVEQQNNKALTTPLNNSLLGEYFRNRLELNNGAFIKKADLENYGRTDVTFYKLDDEQYFMDFSVEK